MDAEAPAGALAPQPQQRPEPQQEEGAGDGCGTAGAPPASDGSDGAATSPHATAAAATTEEDTAGQKEAEGEQAGPAETGPAELPPSERQDPLDCPDRTPSDSAPKYMGDGIDDDEAADAIPPAALSDAPPGAAAEAAAGGGGAAQPPPARPAMLVLDFDLTLSAVHVWNTLARSGSGRIEAARIPRDLPVDVIYGGAERLDMLRGWLRRAHSDGARVVVLTNNYRSVVEQCLACAGLADCVAGVIGREVPGTKGQIVQALMAKHRQVTRWAFADDDVSNVRSVEVATKGRCRCMAVDGSAGMQRGHLDTLRRLIYDE